MGKINLKLKKRKILLYELKIIIFAYLGAQIKLYLCSIGRFYSYFLCRKNCIPTLSDTYELLHILLHIKKCS